MQEVKNKAAAENQITAEQLLREAKEQDLEILPPPPKQKISDPDELADYQHRRRRGYEDSLRENHMVISSWIKYHKGRKVQKKSKGLGPFMREVWMLIIETSHYG
jgi:crooked neck